jgi:flagellar assembly protein FliH
MSSTRNARFSPGPVVLRGVSLHAQPHALTRPDRRSAEPMATMQPPASGRPAVIGDVAGNDGAEDAAYEAGLSEGRRQGYAAGHAAAAAEGVQALHAALKETRVQAADEGRLEGLARGREEAALEATQAQTRTKVQTDQAALDRLDRLDRLLQGVIVEAANRLEQTEDDLVALSHEAVCRILGTEAAQPARLRSMVTHLLAQHGLRAQLAVHLHPEDLAALVQESGETRDKPWRWVGDSAVQLGGVVLRSPEGSLDARLETQLAALGAALLAVRRSRKIAADRATEIMA